MSESPIDTDYLIIGAGAMGMAFADTMLSETDHEMVIVDMHHAPGGHWNDAYPFVTLHQPSSYYGVNSRELSHGRKDQTGLNKGLNELASGAEVLSYFDQVMRHQFLPTGRVKYLPMCEYKGDGEIISLLTGERTKVSIRKKTVDATHLKTSVPSTHTPGFSVAKGVNFIPPNALPRTPKPPAGYIVIGGGKTAIDVVLWLLENQVAADMIQWIRPRDGWLIDRGTTQPTDEFFVETMGTQANQMEAIASAESQTDMFDRLEACGALVRIDPDTRPSMFRGATISQAELAALRTITNVVRLGRVKAIDTDRVILDEGELPGGPDWVLVDCSAHAVSNMVPATVFDGDTIRLQTVRSVQPVFSAAFIAHIEASDRDTAEKNDLCGVVTLPSEDTDWIKMQAQFMMNQFKWSQDPELRGWLLKSRLDGYSQLARSVGDDPERQAIMAKFRQQAPLAMAKLMQFVSEIEA